MEAMMKEKIPGNPKEIIYMCSFQECMLYDNKQISKKDNFFQEMPNLKHPKLNSLASFYRNIRLVF